MIVFVIVLCSLILVGAGLCIFFTIHKGCGSCSKHESSNSGKSDFPGYSSTSDGYLSKQYLSTLSERELKCLKIEWERNYKDADLSNKQVHINSLGLRLDSMDRDSMQSLYNKLDEYARGAFCISDRDAYRSDAFRVKSYMQSYDKLHKREVNLMRINTALSILELLKEEPTKWTELDSTESKEVSVAIT